MDWFSIACSNSPFKLSIRTWEYPRTTSLKGLNCFNERLLIAVLNLTFCFGWSLDYTFSNPIDVSIATFVRITQNFFVTSCCYYGCCCCCYATTYNHIVVVIISGYLALISCFHKSKLQIFKVREIFHKNK